MSFKVKLSPSVTHMHYDLITQHSLWPSAAQNLKCVMLKLYLTLSKHHLTSTSSERQHSLNLMARGLRMTINMRYSEMNATLFTAGKTHKEFWVGLKSKAFLLGLLEEAAKPSLK